MLRSPPDQRLFRVLVFVALVGACDETGTTPTATTPSTAATSEGADGAPAIADIERLSGDVRWQAASHGGWLAARAEQALRESDGVQTMQNADALIRFRAGASIRLEPETTLRIQDQPREATRLRHLSGRLSARLEPETGPRRLEIALPPGDLILEADGADGSPVEARIDVEDDQTEVAMTHGAGRVERAAGEAIEVDEARYLRLDANGEIIERGVDLAAPELLEPADGATVRTRTETSFRWAAAAASTFVLRIEPEVGEVIEVTTDDVEASVALASGGYRWSACVSAEAGRGRPAPKRTVRVEVDRSPPSLTVVSPAPNARRRGSTITVSGRAEAGATVDVNGLDATVSANGEFRAVVQVRPGLTNLVVRARDDLGNSRVVSRPVLVE